MVGKKQSDLNKTTRSVICLMLLTLTLTVLSKRIKIQQLRCDLPISIRVPWFCPRITKKHLSFVQNLRLKSSLLCVPEEFKINTCSSEQPLINMVLSRGQFWDRTRSADGVPQSVAEFSCVTPPIHVFPLHNEAFSRRGLRSSWVQKSPAVPQRWSSPPPLHWQFLTAQMSAPSTGTST